LHKSNDDKVSKSNPYISTTGMEVIDVIEAFTEELRGIEATDTGNIIKHACSWKNKNGIRDLEKIMWYTQHLIEHLKEDSVSIEPVKAKAIANKIKEYYDQVEIESTITSTIFREPEEITLPIAMKVLTKDLKRDKTPGSNYHGWQSNIACTIMDNSDIEHDKANEIAKKFLELLIS
jgi:hypothetical protein